MIYSLCSDALQGVFVLSQSNIFDIFGGMVLIVLGDKVLFKAYNLFVLNGSFSIQIEQEHLSLQSIQKLRTMGRKNECSKRKMKISLKRRLKLIDMVFQQGMSVVRASKKLQLKVCTARSILSKYTKQGLIYDKKQKKNIAPDVLEKSQENEFPSENFIVKEQNEVESESSQSNSNQSQKQQNSTDEGNNNYVPLIPDFTRNMNMFYIYYYY